MFHNNLYHPIIKNQKSNIELEKFERRKLKPIYLGDISNREFEKSQREIKQMVKNVLEVSEEARGNDLILFFECIRLQFPHISIENEGENIKVIIPITLLNILNPPESYRRWRQKFNENNKYLPTSDIIFRRRRKEKAYKIFFAKMKENDHE